MGGRQREVVTADPDVAATDKARAALADFLITLGSCAPEDFMHSVVYESTSYDCVMANIKTTYRLDTKGLGFLAANELKFDIGEDGSTHQQVYMTLKEFYCSALLKQGAIHEGLPLERDEVLTPLAKNFITEKWLDAINPALKVHIKNTRGNLFTKEKPSLADNQLQLSEMMGTLLLELENNPQPSVNQAAVYQQPSPSINRAGFQQPGRRGFSNTPRRFPQPAGPRTFLPRINRSSCPPDTCLRCYEAHRTGPATKNHFAAQCTFPRRNVHPQPMRVFLLPTGQASYQDRLPAQIQEVQLSSDLLQQGEVRQQGEHVQHSDEYGEHEGEYYVEGNDFIDNKYVYEYESGFGFLSDTLTPPTFPNINNDQPPTINIIPTKSIQKFTFYCQHKQIVLALDTGCEGNCITEAECKRLKLEILPLDVNDRTPNQADGTTSLDPIGAVITTFCRDKHRLHFHGYVVRKLSQPILCGLPFIEANEITQNISRKTMNVGNSVIMQDPPFSPGSSLPFNINEVPSSVKDVQLNIREDLHSLIEIGKDVDQSIKSRLQSIHAHHHRVFNGDLRLGYNGASGDHTVNFDFNNGIPPAPHKGSVPNYSNHADAVVLQTKIEELEEQNIVAKVSDLGINLKYASPCMLRKKNSGKQLSKEKYNSLSVKEKSKLNRFVLCLNKLSNHINKKPAAVTKTEETINAVSAYQYIITADLQDSFNQRLISKSKIPFMGFHSPFGDNYVLLRSPQGLLNQSEELELLLKVVLKEGVQGGYVKVQADNIYVLGHTAAEAVDRWERVLTALEENNLKISPKKTACFPASLDLLGWTKVGKFLIPDRHRQNTLLTCEKPITIKELRSFLGTYHTFYKCQKRHNLLLSPLTKILSNNPTSGQKIVWTPEQTKAFHESQKAAAELDKLYTPKQTDQLVITSDYAEKGTNMEAGISATLWAVVDREWFVVARMSAEIEPLQRHLNPCDGEATAIYVAAKISTFAVPIRASTKKTQAMVDSKPLVEAAKLLNQGKFSTSKIINNVMASISDKNLEFHHLSGKLFKNCPDDFGSRFPAPCKDPNSCKVHTFIRECTGFSVSKVSMSVSLVDEGAIIGHIKQDDSVIRDICSGKVPLPLSNKRALSYLQSRDKDLLRVRELLLAGQLPSEKRDFKPVKQFFRSDVQTTFDRDNCLVVIKRNRQTLVTRELVVVPDNISMGLLYSLHHNLNHPSADQLHRAVDTRFFITDIANKCTTVTDECTPCTSIKSIPMEVYEYKQNVVPEHPGQAFTVDVMKEAKKMVVVATDNFSGFITTAFVNSEKELDLRDGIIRTVCPFMASSLTRIRVDRAPGFAKMSSKAATLAELGIDMELGNCKNENKLSLVDQKIKELRIAIKKISPSHNILNQMTLTKATTTVNECIRHHRLSSKEIQFSRDLASTSNLQLNDDDIKEEIEKHRTKTNPGSAKAKSTFNKPAESAEAKVGQLVFLKREGSKSQRRDLYMVIDRHPDDMITICKIRDALSNKGASMVPQDPRYRYEVRQTDIIMAPNQPPPPVEHDVVYEDEAQPDDQHQRYQEQVHNNKTHYYTKYTRSYNNTAEDDELEDEDEEMNVWFQSQPTASAEGGEIAIVDSEHSEESGEDEITIDEEDYREAVNSEQISEARTETVVDDIGEEQYGDEDEDISDEEDDITEEEEDIPAAALPLNPARKISTNKNQIIKAKTRKRFPTKKQFIKFKRQAGSYADKDSHIPKDRFSFAQITAKGKADNRGRMYFNIRLPDDSEDGIYLACRNLRVNDLIWDIVEEADIGVREAVEQVDGAMVTPESLTPESSPECPEPAWDHSPERLSEDGAFLWEETPLRALTATDILEDEAVFEEAEESYQEEISSPLGTFRRQLAFRKKREPNGGYSSNAISHPILVDNVQLDKPNNLNYLLTPNKPIVPEAVDLQKSQNISLVLPDLS